MKNIRMCGLGVMLFFLLLSHSVIWANGNKAPIEQLRFIGEQVIPKGFSYLNTTVGGLSSIDYDGEIYYLISDDPANDDKLNGPVRFYTAHLDFDRQGFNQVSFTSVKELTHAEGRSFQSGEADPEGLRIDPATGHLTWISEGNMKANLNPFVWEAKNDGTFVREFRLPSMFHANGDSNQGPRHNAVFEGVALSFDGQGYWAAMEGPLAQDGPHPGFVDTESLVRIAYIDRKTGEFSRQFTMELDPVFRLPAKPGFQFLVNGLVEILEYSPNQFLVLERSYATNYKDGGNNVKLYKVDASKATDVSKLESLKGQSVTPAAKTLLFDFETIRHQLTNQTVDNIEGMTFGPKLDNGNRSLVFVADDNFALFGPQLNQFLAFEVLSEKPADPPPTTIGSLTYVGEQIIPDGTVFEGTTVGGFSSIDYANGTYYLISDDNAKADDAFQGPIRFYTASLDFDHKRFASVKVESVHEILQLNDAKKKAFSIKPVTVDPEGLRIDPKSGNLIWISEGQINGGLNPTVGEMGTSGEFVREMQVPKTFLVSSTNTQGPRHNAVFEGLSISSEGDGYWVAMESPLKQDGEDAQLEDTEAPIRIAWISRETGKFGFQFAYELDSIARKGSDKAFRVNGVVELLEYNSNQFLVLERSFTSGEADGGNDVKLYKVDASEATDISDIAALKGARYTKAKKTLLFDFNAIRNKLTDSIVDNLEGITFGPDLPNGHKSLVVVSDNNFSAFGRQLNQFLVFQVNP